MRAVVDWSYGLLGKEEQAFLRSLGIFAGGFTAEAAAAVVPGAATTRNSAIDRLADLVGKSLVVVDASGAQPRFRLLDTTRAFAIAKLDESGTRERMARRHAQYYLTLFERAESEVTGRKTGEWLALRLAESLGDTEYQLRALWELWAHHTNTGELDAAHAVARRFYALALEHADPATLPIADRMMGMSYHYLGDQTNAWRHIERMLSADVDPQRRSPLIRF